MSDDYLEFNRAVSTLTDASQHMAGKNLNCKLDCSQAYYLLQTADQPSVDMLTFFLRTRLLRFDEWTSA